MSKDATNPKAAKAAFLLRNIIAYLDRRGRSTKRQLR